MEIRIGAKALKKSNLDQRLKIFLTSSFSFYPTVTEVVLVVFTHDYFVCQFFLIDAIVFLITVTFMDIIALPRALGIVKLLGKI